MKFLTVIDRFRQYGLMRFLKFFFGEITVRYINPLFRGSYSQLGEDVWLDRYFNHKKNGFYVDIGAYDPYRFSNTMRFYRRGWRGINIEPNTELWKRFMKYRKKDINLNIGVGLSDAKMKFYIIDPPTLSTFSRDHARQFEIQGFRIVHTKHIAIKPLAQILAPYASKRIDFLSVDVEGMEMGVLTSNDWDAYRPEIICIESQEFAAKKGDSKKQTELDRFFTTIGYERIFTNGLNAMYKDSR